MSNIIIFILVSLIIVNWTLAQDTKLHSVHVVFRHGITTPTYVYPTATYNETYWLTNYDGLEQLTNEGVEQLDAFGRYIQSEYSSFLPASYDRQKIYVRSSDYDRDLTSANALVNGLYPIANRTDSKPIPVYTTERKRDFVFFDTSNCQRFGDLKKAALKSKEYVLLQNENILFLNELQNNSGLDSLDLYNVSKIANAYLSESALNLTDIPSWLANQTDKLLELNNYKYLIDAYTSEAAKLTSGGLLNEIILNLNSNIDMTSSFDFFLYALDASYIAAIEKLLNLSNNINQPQFASALFIELRKSTASDNKYYIQISYKNNEPNQPITRKILSISYCGKLCPLNIFLDIIQNYLVTDYTTACLSKSNLDYPIVPPETQYTKLETDLIIAISVVSAVVFLGFSLIAVKLYFECRSGKSKFTDG